eukprot:4349520-Prymnesium_polylepis.3
MLATMAAEYLGEALLRVRRSPSDLAACEGIATRTGVTCARACVLQFDELGQRGAPLALTPLDLKRKVLLKGKVRLEGSRKSSKLARLTSAVRLPKFSGSNKDLSAGVNARATSKRDYRETSIAEGSTRKERRESRMPLSARLSEFTLPDNDTEARDEGDDLDDPDEGRRSQDERASDDERSSSCVVDVGLLIRPKNKS